MDFLKRAKKEILSLKEDIKGEMRTNRAAYRPAARVGLAVGTLLFSGVPMLADPDIAEFGSNIRDVVVQVYDAAFPVVTVLAALLLVIAFIVRMTGNQQKASQATSWIIRIIICYVCINCIGLLFKVIRSTTTSYKFNESEFGS